MANESPVNHFAIARTSGQIKGAKLDKDWSSNNFFRTAPANNSVPIIQSFISSPASPAVGDNQVLSWASSFGTSATLDNGIGAVPVSGAQAIDPLVVTTYILTVTNAKGSVQASITVRPIITNATPLPITDHNGLPLYS